MMDDNNNNYSASAIDSASFDIMNEPLIPTQSINPVTPSIPSIFDNILHISTETTAKEHDNLSYCKQTHDDVACSNADLDSYDFMCSAEKDSATAQHTLVTPDRIEDKRIDLTLEEIMHMVSKLPYQKINSRTNLSGTSA